jgi:hypothetical protein
MQFLLTPASFPMAGAPRGGPRRRRRRRRRLLCMQAHTGHVHARAHCAARRVPSNPEEEEGSHGWHPPGDGEAAAAVFDRCAAAALTVRWSGRPPPPGSTPLGTACGGQHAGCGAAVVLMMGTARALAPTAAGHGRFYAGAGAGLVLGGAGRRTCRAAGAHPDHAVLQGGAAEVRKRAARARRPPGPAGVGAFPLHVARGQLMRCARTARAPASDPPPPFPRQQPVPACSGGTGHAVAPPPVWKATAARPPDQAPTLGPPWPPLCCSLLDKKFDGQLQHGTTRVKNNQHLTVQMAGAGAPPVLGPLASSAQVRWLAAGGLGRAREGGRTFGVV